MPKVTVSKPGVGSRWRSKLGRHIGMEGTVVKTSVNMVWLVRTKGRVNGSSNRGGFVKVPLDAFWRKYEPF